MKDLNYAIKQLCQRNRDGSFATQANRAQILDLIATQLAELGFRRMQVTSLRPKHIEALVGRWKSEALSAGTIKNRMAELRWWAEKTGKENVIARTNESYGIPDRKYVTNQSKAKELDMEQLKRITDAPRAQGAGVGRDAGARGSLDELSAPARSLLRHIHVMVKNHCEAHNVTPRQYVFTRKDVRETTG